MMELNISPRVVRQDIRAIDAQIATLQRSRGLLEQLLADLTNGKSSTPAPYQRRNKASGDALRRQVYEALDRENPKPTKQVAEEVKITTNTAIKYLRELTGVGKARETTGNERVHLKWVRTPLSVTPGEEVDLTK